MITRIQKMLSHSQTTMASTGFADYPGPDTIRDRIDKMADAYPNELAYIYPHNGDLRLKYSEIKSRVYKIMENLMDLGIRPRDHVAFFVANSHEHALSILACASLGAVCVLLDYVSFKFTDITKILIQAEVKVLFMFDSYNSLDYESVLNQLTPPDFNSNELPHLTRVILIIGNDNLIMNRVLSGDFFILYEDLLDAVPSGPKELPLVDSRDPFVIIFTVSLLQKSRLNV